MGSAYGFDENKNKVPMTPPQSLTINGDFQINKRGQASYSGAVYTVDMWKLHTELGQLVVNDGYVTLTGSALKQYIPIDTFETKSYTQVVKLKDETAKVFHYDNFNGIYKELTVDGLKCSLEYSTTNKVLCFYIWQKDSAINIEYADLFDSDIVYKHQKEDYATALMRCKNNIRDCNLIGYQRFDYGTDALFACLFEQEFEKPPVLSNITATFYKKGSTAESVTIDIPSATLILNDLFQFRMNKSELPTGTNCVFVRCIASIEPL